MVCTGGCGDRNHRNCCEEQNSGCHGSFSQLAKHSTVAARSIVAESRRVAGCGPRCSKIVHCLFIWLRCIAKPSQIPVSAISQDKKAAESARFAAPQQDGVALA